MEKSNITPTPCSSFPQDVEEAKKINNERDYEESLDRPEIEYDGRIHYYATLIDFAYVCDNLLRVAENSEEILIMGFDIEWYFSLLTGPRRTAVIQISSELDTCFIFHVINLLRLPKAFNELLAHQKVRLVGINIKNDMRKLAKDFPGFDANKAIANCTDLGVFANRVLPHEQAWSLQSLVKYFLKMEVDKSRKVRLSKWHVVPLSDVQLRYAATVAYAALKLYYHLKEVEESNRHESLNQSASTTRIFPTL